ncbi:MAG: isopentenyl-diphosphate Delta-isomerase [Flavobacteriales bacterium]
MAQHDPNPEHVVLVNEWDEELGLMEKLEAHRTGALHRAFSIFLFDKQGRLLLQQRALGKYHSAGLWTNTCCSHPRSGEDLLAAAHRRLKEEMGLTAELEHRFSFIYRGEVGDGLWEHELDHVFTGLLKEVPVPDPAEVMDFRWVEPEQLAKDLATDPKTYTIWLRKCWPQVAGSLHATRA